MRKDHDLVLHLLRDRKIDVNVAKAILSSPLIVIPDPDVTSLETNQLTLLNPDNVWGKYMIDTAWNDIPESEYVHPLIQYTVLSSIKVISSKGTSVAIQHVFIRDHGDGTKSIRSTVIHQGLNRVVGSKVFIENNGVLQRDDGSGEFGAYLSTKELLHRWLDYTRSLRLTPVLQSVKGNTVSKKSPDGLKVKSAPHASIIFLDRLPTRSESVKDVERVCTESTTKRGHQRIAYRKTLTADRYRNHPKYMVKDGVRVRTTWVGERTSSDLEGNTYTVMELK